jgi:copper chaperone
MPRRKPAVDSTVITVSGMTCEHCVAAVEKEIGSLPGVARVEVGLDTGTVRIAGDPLPGISALRDAVIAAGYEMAD